MEDALTPETGLIKRAFWLVKLRWMAVLGAGSVIVPAHCFFAIPLHIVPLGGVVCVLALENVLCPGLLRRVRAAVGIRVLTYVRRIVNFQISTFNFTLPMVNRVESA